MRLLLTWIINAVALIALPYIFKSITVDSLAHPYGKGIAAETYRWAELEQLVYSPSRWERRLIGSTVATMTHVDRTRGRDPEVEPLLKHRRLADAA